MYILYLSRTSLIMTESNKKKSKSNLHYTRGITPKHVTSGGTHLCGLGPGQHSCEETSQRWQAVGNTVFDLTGPGIESQTFRTDSVLLTTELTGPRMTTDNGVVSEKSAGFS